MGISIVTATDPNRVVIVFAGEVTFKRAQILSVAGQLPSALTMLDEAVTQGFVCVACFETSSLLEPVRAPAGYGHVRERALDRQLASGRRFGLFSTSPPER